MNDSQQNKRFASSAAWVLLARIMAFVSVFGITAITARSLTPADFGVFALLFSLLGLTSLIGTYGLNRALVKVFAENGDGPPPTLVLSKCLKQVCWVSGALAIACVAVLGSLVSWAVAIPFAVIVFARAVQLVLAESCRGFHEKIWANLFGGISGGPLPHLIIMILIAGLWSLQAVSLPVLLWVYAAVVLIGLVPLARKTNSLAQANAQGAKSHSESAHSISPAPASTVNASTNLLALAIPLMFTQVFGLALSQADIWLAGAMVAPALLGIYAAAQRMLAFLTVPLQISNTAIVSFIPQLYSQNKVEKLQQMISLAATVSSIPALIVGGIFLIFAEPILTIAFGEFFAQSANILRILTIGQLVCVLTGPSEVVLMMTGHQRITWRVNLLAVIGIVVCGCIALTYGGLMGLAITLCLATAIQNLTTWYLAWQRVGIKTNCTATGFDLAQIIRLIPWQRSTSQ